MRYNKLLPPLIPFLVFVFFEIFFLNSRMIYVSVVLSSLLILFAIRQFSLVNLREDWWNFLVLPILFLIGIASYSSVLISRPIIQILFVVNVVFLYFYLRMAYYSLVQPIPETNLTIDNLSSYGSFLAVFFISSAMFGLQSFLNLSVWALALVMAVVIFLIVRQAFWANKIDLKASLVYILISGLILVELVWAVSFLPLNFNISGLILAACYYMLIGLVRHHLLGRLDRRTIELYLAFGFGSIFIILLSARWM